MISSYTRWQMEILFHIYCKAPKLTQLNSMYSVKPHELLPPTAVFLQETLLEYSLQHVCTCQERELRGGGHLLK